MDVIGYLKHLGKRFYPISHTKAIYDNDGKVLEDRLSDIVNNSKLYTDDKITNEKSDRQNADSLLQNQINSLAGADGLLQNQIGYLSDLTTDNKTSLVAAVSEAYDWISSWFDGADTSEPLTLKEVNESFFKQIPQADSESDLNTLTNIGVYCLYNGNETLNYPNGETSGALLVLPDLDGAIQMFIPWGSDENPSNQLYIRTICMSPDTPSACEWATVGSQADGIIETLRAQIASKITRPDNAIYVYCDGVNDAAKINVALGEGAATSAEKRIVYLVGNCVLDASDLILDETNTTKAYVIRPCANVIFDGTYCESLTWDGSAEVANSVAYRVFNFTKGACGFRNIHIKYANMDNAWYAPAFVYYEPAEDKGSFIMRDMVIDDMQADNNRYLIIISGAVRSLVENVTFKRLTIKSRNTATQCMVFGSCDFVNNRFYGLTYSNANAFATKFIALSKCSRFENNYFENVDASSALRIDISTNSTFKNNMFYTCYVAPQVSFQDGCIIAENNYRDCTVKDYMFSYSGTSCRVEIKDNFLKKLTLAGDSSIFNMSYGSLMNNSVHIWKLDEGVPMYSIAEIYCDMYYTNVMGNTVTFSSGITFPENFAPFDIYTGFDTGAFIEKNYTNAPTLMTTNGDGEIISKDNVIAGATQA